MKNYYKLCKKLGLKPSNKIIFGCRYCRRHFCNKAITDDFKCKLHSYPVDRFIDLNTIKEIEPEAGILFYSRTAEIIGNIDATIYKFKFISGGKND